MMCMWIYRVGPWVVREQPAVEGGAEEEVPDEHAVPAGEEAAPVARQARQGILARLPRPVSIITHTLI